jgi:hypothetical protein
MGLDRKGEKDVEQLAIRTARHPGVNNSNPEFFAISFWFDSWQAKYTHTKVSN